MSGTKSRTPLAKKTGHTLWLHSHGRTFALNTKKTQTSSHAGASSGTPVSNGVIVSPMPGKILKIALKEGEKVNAGDTVCILEAMKMEYSLKAPFEGIVQKVYKKTGEAVSLEEKIIEIKKQ